MGFWNRIPFWVWLVVLIGILAGMLHRSHLEVMKYKEEANLFENTISDLNQKIKETEVRMNDSITLYQAEVRDLNYSADNLKAKYDDLLKATELKAKDVGSMTSVVSKVANRDTVVALKDTFGGLKAVLNDGFVRIDVSVMQDRKTIIDYEVHDSLTVINVQKRHSILFGLIKWKSWKSTRVINHNPKARIVGLETINVIEK